jgi:dipeptidyl aminopeptidase/acylaminoacyl peptidase
MSAVAAAEWRIVMRSVVVSFFSGPGQRLHGVLYLPDDADEASPVPGVVLALGYRPVLEMFAPKYAAALVPHGYAVLTFEYRGFGASEGPRWRPVAAEQLEDLTNAFTYMLTRPEIDPQRVAVWGDASTGGAYGIMLAAREARVRCLVVASALADGGMLLRSTRPEWEWQDFMARVEADRRRRVTTGESELVRPESIMEFAPSDSSAARDADGYDELARMMYPLAEGTDAVLDCRPVEHIHAIAPRPVLIIHAAHDKCVPVDHAHMLYERAGSPKKLALLTDASHYDIHHSMLGTTVQLGLDWFATHMRDRKGETVVESEG